MIRTLLLASTIAVGITGAAFAEGGPRLVGGGPDADVAYDAPSRNVVGGGTASYAGGGRDEHIAYGGTVTNGVSGGLIGEIVGEAGNRHVVYHQATPPAGSGQLAGRPGNSGG